MKIEVSDPGFYFAFFYALSFLVTFLLVILFSYRLKINLLSVLLMLTTVSLCAIVGSRLTTIPVSEWGRVIISGRFERYQGRFAVGGMLFGLAGLVFSQKNLGIEAPILNLFAWTTPIGLGIQKIGCFINGCCYGKPTDLPLSIQYPIGTSAHFHQMVNGVIDENAAYSLNIIPVQLFEVICLFTISFIVWRTLKIWKKSGSALIFSFILFFIFRFAAEFLRDPASSNFNNVTLSGLTMLQWFFLMLVIVCAIILLLYEKRLETSIQKPSKSEQALKKPIAYILVVSAVTYIFRGLFTPFELLSLYIKFIPAILLTAYYVYESLKTFRFQLATTSFFVLPLLLITQTLLPDSAKSGAIKNFYENEVKSYKRIDIGTSLGQYNSTVRYDPHEGECGTEYTRDDYKYAYRIAGAGYSSIKKHDKSITTSGINLYGGSIKEVRLTSQLEKTNFLIGVNPYIKYDINWLGIGVGAHLGNIRWVPANPIDQVTFNKGTRFSPFMPEIYMRMGRRDILDLKYTYGFNFPTSFPVLLHDLSIGSGFGHKTDFSLRLGKTYSYSDSFTFISAEGLLNKKFGLSFRYNFGGEDFYSDNTTEFIKRKGRILLGVNYRFGFQQ